MLGLAVDEALKVTLLEGDGSREWSNGLVERTVTFEGRDVKVLDPSFLFTSTEELNE